MSIVGAQAEPTGLWPRLKSAFVGPKQGAPSNATDQNLPRGEKSWILGLLASAAVAGLTLNQAEQTVRFGALKHPYNGLPENQQNHALFHNPLSFLARTIETIAKPAIETRKWLTEKSSSPESEENKTQLAKNLKPKLSWLSAILDKKFASSLGSFIFAYENMFSSFFVKRPPGEETNVSNIWTALFPPLSKFTSALGSALSLFGHGSAGIFRLGGVSETNGYHASKFIGRLGDIFLPAASNLNAFFKTLMARKLSRTTGLSQTEAFREYGLNPLHILQGIMGSLLALPSLFGSASRFRTIFNENEGLIHNYLTSVTQKFKSILKASGEKFNISSLKKLNVDQGLEAVKQGVTEIIKNTETWVTAASESIWNLPIIKEFAQLFLPIDPETERVTMTRDITPANEGIATDPRNKLWGTFNKGTLIRELDHISRPIQSTLMLLPAAWPKITDPDIQRHGNFVLRSVDKLLGLSSLILGPLSFLVYACSMRVPKLITMWYANKQKIANARRHYDYDAMQELKGLRERLINHSWLPFASFIGQSLKRIVHNEFGPKVFHDEKQYLELLENLEKDAQSQETHVKVLSTLEYIRNFMRGLITNSVTAKIFKGSFAVGELTSKEEAKMRIYKGLEAAEATIRTLIPGLGTILALPATFIKKFFAVRTQTGENPMQLLQKQMGANTAAMAH